MTLSDIEHCTTMINGCESINQRDYSHPDAIYASAVLQLHANDMGSYAGQEGFLDQVKKGAGSVKEWIAKIFKAILEFFKGSGKKAKDFEAGYKALKAKHQAKLKNNNSSDSGDNKESSSKVEEKIEINPEPIRAELDKALKELEQWDKTKLSWGYYTSDFAKSISAVNSALKSLDGDTPDPWKASDVIVSTMESVTADGQKALKEQSDGFNKYDDKVKGQVTTSRDDSRVFNAIPNALEHVTKAAAMLGKQISAKVGNVEPDK